MSKPVKVYNKGTRPVVFKRDRTGVDAIHPGKFLLFDSKKAEEVIKNFKDACSESDYEKHCKEVAKKQADIKEKAESEAQKETKSTSKK